MVKFYSCSCHPLFHSWFLWPCAGLFGFLINPPIALYYMQGLNTTPVHGHRALFGVYGMLGIGLMMFVLIGLKTGWSINKEVKEIQ